MSDKRQQNVEAEFGKQRKSGIAFPSLENIMSGALNGAGSAIMDAAKEAHKKEIG